MNNYTMHNSDFRLHLNCAIDNLGLFIQGVHHYLLVVVEVYILSLSLSIYIFFIYKYICIYIYYFLLVVHIKCN